VQLQLVLSRKTLSTAFASKRSFSSVRSNVSIKMRDPRELGFAESTRIRSYIVVHLKMASQVGEVGAVLVADWTDGGGRLGHDGIHIVWKQIEGNSALLAHLSVMVERVAIR